MKEIRYNEALKSAVAKVRAAETEKERKKLKATTLPWFSLAEFGNDNHRSKDDFIMTKFLVHDLDHLENPMEIKARLGRDPHVLMSFVSPSGKGLRVVQELEREISDHEQYRRIYTLLAKEFQKKYGVEPDQNGDKASQAWFYGYDPDIYVNPNAKMLPVPKLDALPKEEKPKKPSIIQMATSGSSTGGRTENLTRQIGFYMRHGLSEEDTLLEVREWNKKNNPPLDEHKVESTVRDMYKRYHHLPVRYFEEDGCYFKNVGNGKDSRQVQMSTFTIDPKELLVLPDSDCLRCSISTPMGHTYENILIENTDWHTRAKILKAIGHQDCSFLGSEIEIQTLCSYVNANVNVRKTGTRTIGLIGDYWVTENSNISVSGVVDPAQVIPYDKGSDAFYHKISYPNLSDEEYVQMAREFYGGITSINDPNVILPWIGWTFASVLKPRMLRILGGFPLLFVHGAKGTGKTSTAGLMMKILGYKDRNPRSVTMKPFPILKLLSSTNAIPVFLDEYKRDMPIDHLNNIHRYIRRVYNAEVESKGRADQTTVDYYLTAPLVVMGEWDITEPAIKERVLMSRFTGVVENNKDMKRLFGEIQTLPVDSFMPKFVQFALRQNVEDLLKKAREVVLKSLGDITIASRIENNLTVMVAGLELFDGFARTLELDPPERDLIKLLKNQLEEITGSSTGFVRSAVDQLIEELGIMWQKSERQGFGAKPWWKIAKVGRTKVLAIRFKDVFPEFKEYAKRTSYEGELLDRSSYMKLFEDTPYVVTKDAVVDFEGKKHRCVCINLKEAKKVKIDLEGFSI
ncbi:MAG: BT4734/BF3469 family protein, partial [Bacteroidota bacterium]